MRRSGGNDVAGWVVETLPGMVAGGGVAETLPGIVGATPVAAAVVVYWDVTGTSTEVTPQLVRGGALEDRVGTPQLVRGGPEGIWTNT